MRQARSTLDEISGAFDSGPVTQHGCAVMLGRLEVVLEGVLEGVLEAISEHAGE